jgi:bacterioferritin-associated ferredoxin
MSLIHNNHWRIKPVNDEELDAYELEILRAGERKDFINDEVLVCECMCISAKDIRNLFSDTQIVDLEVLKKELSLGSGCSSCIKSFSEWKDNIFPRS